MLGNFLKIDNIFVCFFIPLKSAYFYLEWWTKLQTGWISGQLPSSSAAGLDLTRLHKHKCGSRTERVNDPIITVWAVVRLGNSLNHGSKLQSTSVFLKFISNLLQPICACTLFNLQPNDNHTIDYRLNIKLLGSKIDADLVGISSGSKLFEHPTYVPIKGE